MEHFPNPRVPNFHMYTGSAYTVFCLYIYYKVCTVEAGVVTKGNVKDKIKRFPYDGYVFPPNTVCTTCKTVK